MGCCPCCSWCAVAGGGGSGCNSGGREWPNTPPGVWAAGVGGWWFCVELELIAAVARGDTEGRDVGREGVNKEQTGRFYPCKDRQCWLRCVAEPVDWETAPGSARRRSPKKRADRLGRKSELLERRERGAGLYPVTEKRRKIFSL